jgi:hypothetical protein
MMTEEEYAAEFDYRLDERLGILCGSNPPTREQKAIAYDEASKALMTLSNGEWVPF